MGLVFGWGCFEMECFLTVLKGIGIAAVLAAILAAAGLVWAVVTLGSAWLFGVAPNSGAFLCIQIAWFVVLFGTLIGITECHA